MSASDPMTPNYGAYLQLGTLLSAQRPPDFARLAPGDDPTARSRDLLHHDEHLFIVVHQVFELWFSQVLHDLGRARDLLGRQGDGAGPRVPEARIADITASLNRVNAVLEVAMQGFSIMETMNPTDFLEFRDALIPSSGFQSVQFRELEILAGLPDTVRMDFEGVPYAARLTETERERIARREEEMTLRAALVDWLVRTPIETVYPDFGQAYREAFAAYLEEQKAHQDRNPNLAASQKAAARKRFDAQLEALDAYLFGGDAERNRAHQAFLFIASYRTEPLLRWPSALIDSLIAFEQGFRIFRYRHARMVERMIGSRVGSGGSAGVAYLDGTSNRYRIFDDLLEARNFLIAGSRVPKLPDEGLLGFRFGGGD